jgi:hypothetical protein
MYSPFHPHGFTLKLWANPNRMRKSAKALNGLFQRKTRQARGVTTKNIARSVNYASLLL